MKTDIEFEKTSYSDVEPVSEQKFIANDPAIEKKNKKVKTGLTVPAIIFAVIAAAACGISWLFWSGAKDALTSGEVAEAVFGGLILIVLYIASSAITAIASLPTIILSIILLAKRKLKSTVLPIILLVICVAIIASLILGFVFLGN